MREMMMMLADALSEKDLLDQLKKAIADYENAVTASEKRIW